LDTPETIRAALEKFGGSFAIAAMDPVRHKSRLVLAKGPTSPLYVFENDNVIVWASEHKVIKDTWGDLVGTPPKSEKIKFVGEGRFLIADDYGELGLYEFKVKPKPVRQPVQSWSRGYQRPAEKAAVFHRPWDSDGPFNTIGDFKTALAHFRSNPPEGFVLARRWDLLDSYDEDTDFTDVEGNRQWPSCMCGHGILGQDMVTHLKYGAICKDCYQVTRLEWEKNGKKEPSGLEVEGVAIPEVATQDWKNLDSWAEIESRLHRYTLAELSDATGYSMRAIEFLIHRTGVKSNDFGVGMTSLKFALVRAYDKLYDEITTNYWNEILAEAEEGGRISADEAQKQADEQMYPWTAASVKHSGADASKVYYNCEVHGETFPYGESCSSCVFRGERPGLG
jgi:Asparagine synthase (glutamine-hydrolyzing)